MFNPIPKNGRKVGPRIDQGRSLRDAMGLACADALRAAWPRFTTKKVAQFMAERGAPVHPDTVKKWLAGQLPCAHHLSLLFEAFGEPLIRVVTAPCLTREPPSLEEMIEGILRQVLDIREQLKEMRNEGNNRQMALSKPRLAS